MKPYGVTVVQFPDVGDIKQMGAKSSTGGRNYGRNTAAKAKTRRYWKRQARRAGRVQVAAEQE